MIKVLKKLKYYNEVLYNEQVYNIEKEIIYKYQIKDGKSFSDIEFKKILKENEYYYFDRFSKKKLSKLLTIKELKDLLINEGCPSDLVNELIANYLSFNYLNDDYYVKTYLDSKGRKEGKKLIKERLIKKGINDQLIDKYLINVSESNKLSELIDNRKSKYPNLTKQQLTNKLTQYFVQKGFDYYLVKDEVNKSLAHFQVDEVALISKDYQKLVKKYRDDFSKIKQKLYEKGYDLTLINEIVNKK